MKATTLLEKQHRKVEAIFKKIESAKPTGAPALVTELANDLVGHMVIEQEIFYPAAKQVKTDLVLESYEEHALAAHGLKRLVEAAPDDESFHAKVTALKELIEHHVEEEEKDLFPKVEKALGQEAIEALGKKMKTRFDEVVESGYEKVLARAKSSRGTFDDQRSRSAK
jgi:iron-sulfur cluster repair protein YtfE (RIC family)